MWQRRTQRKGYFKVVRIFGQVIRRMIDAPLPGKRRRGRHKTRWKDSCKIDMESGGLKVEDGLDRTKWKRKMQNYSGDNR